MSLVANALLARAAQAEDGGNDVCPAVAVDADDVRERYDERDRLVHQLRLLRGRVVQEVAVAYRGDHAFARSEATPLGRRIARTYWSGDRVAVAECEVDGLRTAHAAYHYDGSDRLVALEKYTLVSGRWQRELTSTVYDAEGRVLSTEVRSADGRVLRRSQMDRALPAVPVVVALTAGGAYQSDSQLYDASAGLGIHREPKPERYASDPLELNLDGTYRFHRAAGLTSTDQTTVRLSADYHDIAPRITLFTFMATDRNLPTNLRLNFEGALLGGKVDIVRHRNYQLDLSFAPVWNFRSISAPTPEGTSVDETTSKLRGSVRARAGMRFSNWSLLDTFEFLPTLYGDDVASEDDFWHRSVVRNTVTFEVTLSRRLKFLEIFKYTWDPAMRAQADCPDGDNPLCLGYAFTSTTALSLNWEL